MDYQIYERTDIDIYFQEYGFKSLGLRFFTVYSDYPRKIWLYSNLSTVYLNQKK